jgi:hypothetical protein
MWSRIGRTALLYASNEVNKASADFALHPKPRLLECGQSDTGFLASINDNLDGDKI